MEPAQEDGKKLGYPKIIHFLHKMDFFY